MQPEGLLKAAVPHVAPSAERADNAAAVAAPAEHDSGARPLPADQETAVSDPVEAAGLADVARPEPPEVHEQEQGRQQRRRGC